MEKRSATMVVSLLCLAEIMLCMAVALGVTITFIFSDKNSKNRDCRSRQVGIASCRQFIKINW